MSLLSAHKAIVSQKDAEIDRLKKDNVDLQTCLDASVFTYNQADAECSRLRTLCARAADALESYHRFRKRASSGLQYL